MTEEPDTGRLLALYADADGDGFGDAASLTLLAAAGAGWVADATDCDDTNADVHPGAAEVCNEVDEDCDGSIDEGVQVTAHADADLDGWGDPDSSEQMCTVVSGWTYNRGDCDDTNADRHPGVSEVCDGIDDDCDGVVDDGVQLVFYADRDGDGYGDGSVEGLACAPSAGWVDNRADCDDADAAVHSGAVDVSGDGVDQDCDGMDLADYEGTLYFASGYDRTPEPECERAYTTALTPSAVLCPDCEYTFDVAYTFDPSVSHDDGSCLDWAPPAADFERTLSVDIDAAAVWAAGGGGSWELTQYRNWDGGDTMYYVIGTDTVVIPEFVYHPNTDPYCYYHCWGWTEVYYNYYTGWLVFRAALP